MAAISRSSDIEIISLLPEHRQSVINLLMSSFFIQEPLNARLQFDIPHEVLSWADYLVDISLRDQCSFVAIDRTSLYQNVVGIILNGISDRTQNEEIVAVESEKLNFIFSLLDKVLIGSDLFDLYQTNRLFRCDIITVEESHRRQNLSAQLIVASEDKARQLGLQGAYVVCTSLYSKKAFQRQDFQVINEIFYSEHGNGRLTDMGEHDRCSLLAKKL
jgi:N-acetylglutamate synthase-like GNAT family acetyltransferase